MKRMYLYCLILVAVCVMSSACIIAYVDSPGSRGFLPGEEYHRAVKFPPGGVLSLSNFDGDIEILGWKNQEVEVYVEKMHDQPSDRKVRLMHLGSDLTPEIDFEQENDHIKINTRAVHKGGENCRADYYISVPHDINLHDILARDGDIRVADLYGSVLIELRSGNVVVDNFSGSLTANVTQGSITAAIYDLRDEDSINLKCDHGDLTLYLQPDVNARIEAYFPGGTISSAFDFDETPNEDRVTEQIGEKGASIYLTALEGSIIIKKTLQLN